MRTIITPHEDSFLTYLKKAWSFRSLILSFAKRDIKIKYAQTFIGLGWTILQPLTGMLLYSFFFGYLMKFDSEGLPYVLFVTSGLVAWNLFAYVVYQGAASTQETAHVIRKVYFPKIVLPLSKVMVGLVEMAVGLGLLFPLIWWYGIQMGPRLLLLPIAILMSAMAGFTLVIWVASFAYRYRDLYHLLPYLVYFGIWMTPVFFSKTFLPETIRFVMYFNPMSGVVELWRWCLFPDYVLLPVFGLSFPVLVLLCAVGVWLFSKAESKFSDYV